MANKIDSGMM